MEEKSTLHYKSRQTGNKLFWDIKNECALESENISLNSEDRLRGDSKNMLSLDKEIILALDCENSASFNSENSFSTDSEISVSIDSEIMLPLDIKNKFYTNNKNRLSRYSENRLSLDSGISLGYCVEETPKKEQISFNSFNQQKHEEAFDASLLIDNSEANRLQTDNGQVTGCNLLDNKVEMRNKEEKYLQIISDCLRNKKPDLPLLKEEKLELVKQANITDILSSLESNEDNPMSFKVRSVMNEDFHSKTHTQTKRNIPYEHNSTESPNIPIPKSKVSNFFSTAGNNILSIVSPTSRISNGIPLAEEVKKIKSTSPTNKEEIKQKEDNKIYLTYNLKYKNTLLPKPDSCLERILKQRQTRKVKQRQNNIQLLNKINKLSKESNTVNIEVEFLNKIVYQLEYIEEGHLTLAKEIDQLKSL